MFCESHGVVRANLFICEFVQKIREHICARFNVGRSGELLNVVADAVYAGDEHHRGGAVRCEHLRIVTGAAGHGTSRVTERLCKTGDACNQIGREHHWLKAREGARFDADAFFDAHGLHGSGHQGLGIAQRHLIGVTQVDGHHGAPGDYAD